MTRTEQPVAAALSKEVTDSDAVAAADDRSRRELDSCAAALWAGTSAEASGGAATKRCLSRCSVSAIQRAAAVEKLFPTGVIAFELCGVGSPNDLFPSERECVARAVEKRANEFAAGRLSARAAGLTELGIKPTPLLPGADCMPIWRSGIVGSITHTNSYCAAVVGPETQCTAFGLESEYIGSVSPSLWRLALRAEELSRLRCLDEAACRQMAAVIFSANEAFYKCQYAWTRRRLGFEDVVVDIAGDAFEVSVVEAKDPTYHTLSPWIGHFRVGETLVVAGIAAERHLPPGHGIRTTRTKRRRRLLPGGIDVRDVG